MKHALLALTILALSAACSSAKKELKPSSDAATAEKNQSAESMADGAKLDADENKSQDMFGAAESGDLLVVHFPFDSSVLTIEAQAKLRNNADWLREHPAAKIVVEGHTDERGADEYNLALGERRAKSVRDYMALLGIDSSRMETVSYGSQQPASRAGTEDAWAENRRAAFRELQ